MLLVIDMPKENEVAFTTLIKRLKVGVLSYEAEGPAGGNPRWHFVIEDIRHGVALMMFYLGPTGAM